MLFERVSKDESLRFAPIVIAIYVGMHILCR